MNFKITVHKNSSFYGNKSRKTLYIFKYFCIDRVNTSFWVWRCIGFDDILPTSSGDRFLETIFFDLIHKVSKKIVNNFLNTEPNGHHQKVDYFI